MGLGYNLSNRDVDWDRVTLSHPTCLCCVWRSLGIASKKLWRRRHEKLTTSGGTGCHLFFADNLLLFREAFVKQARAMHEILSEFCGESGQRVKVAKSQIWYAPKTPITIITTISKTCDISSTSELGRYLGSPIIHGRTRYCYFEYLLGKVHGRLGGWKQRLLSQAAWLLLIQYVTTAIPAYGMTSCKVPGRIMLDLERANRRFLWGDRDKQHWHGNRFANLRQRGASVWDSYQT